MGASLIAAFAAVSGSAWSAEAEKAWAEAYGAITNVMLQGAWEAQHEGEPPWWDAEVVSRTRHGDDLVVLTLRPHHRLRYSPASTSASASPPAGHLAPVLTRQRAPRRPHRRPARQPRRGRGAVHRPGAADPGGRCPAARRTGRRPDLRAPVERPLTFIAAGTGWAPVKALLQQLDATHEARLFLVARDTSYLYDRSAVERLQSRLPRLGVTFITPRPAAPRPRPPSDC